MRRTSVHLSAEDEIAHFFSTVPEAECGPELLSRTDP
jgi:hypothetical protein